MLAKALDHGELSLRTARWQGQSRHHHGHRFTEGDSVAGADEIGIRGCEGRRRVR